MDFDEVRNAMDTLLFSQTNKDTIWSVLAAVLHLGNIAFTDKRNPDVDEVAKVANKETLAFAAKLIGCDSKVRVVLEASNSKRTDKSHPIVSV